MSYNFYFISGRNPASTIQALQQAPKAQPEPRPRPVLQLVDQTSPEIAPLTEANVQARTPDPRPRNRDILRQRAETVRDDASIRAPSSRRSRNHRSRSPGRQSTQVTGQIDFPPPPPHMEFPPGQWSQNTQGIWNQYGESTTLLPPVVSDPHFGRPPAVAVPQPRPPGFPHFTLTPRHNPQAGQSPPAGPAASRPFSAFPPFPGIQTVPRPLPRWVFALGLAPNAVEDVLRFLEAATGEFSSSNGSMGSSSLSWEPTAGVVEGVSTSGRDGVRCDFCD